MREDTEQKHSSSGISDLAGQIGNYFDTRMELLKLNLYENISIATGKTMTSGLAVRLFSMMMLFAGAAAAIWLGEVYKSYAFGFGIVSGVYLALFVLFLLMKQVFDRKIADKMIAELCKEEEEEEEDEEA